MSIQRVFGSVFDTDVIEINSLGSGDRDSALDLTSADEHTDYSARISRLAGVNGSLSVENRGTGSIRIKYTDLNGGHQIGSNGFEINSLGTDDRSSYLDFHSDDTNVGYSARIIRIGGVNGGLSVENRGTGGVRIEYTDLNGGHQIGSTGFEINSLGTGDRTSYLDFHSDDTNLEYSARISRTAGVNGGLSIDNRGTGGLRIEYADLDGGHRIGSTGFEINSLGTGDRSSYLDFNSDDTNIDYSARIIRTGGVNSDMEIENSGTGSMLFITNSMQRLEIQNGVQVGAPTGGDKGHGSINVSGDIYKNNTAYTNPDYVFEYAYTGRIEKHADREGAREYHGKMGLDRLREYTRENYRLPGITSAPTGMFERGDKILEKLEELTLYILELHDRLKKLEGN